FAHSLSLLCQTINSLIPFTYPFCHFCPAAKNPGRRNWTIAVFYVKEFLVMTKMGFVFGGCLVVFLLVPALARAGEAQNAFNEGVKFYQTGKYKEAVAAFNRAIKAAPKADEAYNNRGLAYFKLGENDAAIKDYDDAL